jgi:hypothetical protein
MIEIKIFVYKIDGKTQNFPVLLCFTRFFLYDSKYLHNFESNDSEEI